MTPGEKTKQNKTKQNIASTVWTLVCKMMSLLFNTLFSFAIAFFPRKNHSNTDAPELTEVSQIKTNTT